MDLALEIAPGPMAADKARDSVGERFAGAVQPGQLHDLQVVVGELVANSVEHGPGQPIQLRVELNDEGVLRGEIEDAGDGLVAIAEMSESHDRGLGLHIVDALTDEWAVYEGSTHVWFEIGKALPPREA